MTLIDPSAQALLDIYTVVFSPDAPITFKSGIISPIYVDNRHLPYEPQAWHTIIDAWRDLITSQNLIFDVIAGIETGGIPHSAALAYTMNRPSVFVRKQPKDHGTKRRVEGGDVAGKRVLLIEDTITTGGSSLSGVEALRDEGAQIVACLAIFNYGFPQAAEAFSAAQVPLFTLTSLTTVLGVAQKTGYFTPEIIIAIENWHQQVSG